MTAGLKSVPVPSLIQGKFIARRHRTFGDSINETQSECHNHIAAVVRLNIK